MCFDRHSWTQWTIVTAPLRDLNAHRNALHDFREVAGRVVGWQESELCSGRRTDAFHFAFDVTTWIGIDVDLGDIVGVAGHPAKSRRGEPSLEVVDFELLGKNRAPLPDTFQEGRDVVIEGKLGSSGTFEASTVLTKCGSRYEAGAEAYES